MQIHVVIPAFKEQTKLQDVFLKKLAGRPLIERILEKVKPLKKCGRISVLTDDEQVSLLVSRLGEEVIETGEAFTLSDVQLAVDCLKQHLKGGCEQELVVVLSPYYPLLHLSELMSACLGFESSEALLLLPYFQHVIDVVPASKNTLPKQEQIQSFSKAFFILKKGAFTADEISTELFEVTELSPEISNFHQWWVCEKLINRKRIVFNVIGNSVVGMGHVYRSLSLAHDISDHEIIFVCPDEQREALVKLRTSQYPVVTCAPDELQEKIIELTPELVINDMLNTEQDFMLGLQSKGIKTLNFEDLGYGAREADLTINELYDQPIWHGDNVLWGNEYFFVRDEFASAKKVEFAEQVKAVLITFGGTDQNNFTSKVLEQIFTACNKLDIQIYIVTGDGYQHKSELVHRIEKLGHERVCYLHKTGIMSSVMEKVQLAITSNGRTVYELAHMNIPAITLSHHEREASHSFACKENGFIPLGTYKSESTMAQLSDNFQNLITDPNYRKCLYERTLGFDFNHNKLNVVDKINQLIDRIH